MQSEILFVVAQRPCDIPKEIRFFSWTLNISQLLMRPVCCFWIATARTFSQSSNIVTINTSDRWQTGDWMPVRNPDLLFSLSARVHCFVSATALLISGWGQPLSSSSRKSSAISEGCGQNLSAVKGVECWNIWFEWAMKTWDETLDISWHHAGTFLLMQNPLTWISASVSNAKIKYDPELFLN